MYTLVVHVEKNCFCDVKVYMYNSVNVCMTELLMYMCMFATHCSVQRHHCNISLSMFVPLTTSLQKQEQFDAEARSTQQYADSTDQLLAWQLQHEDLKDEVKTCPLTPPSSSLPPFIPFPPHSSFIPSHPSLLSHPSSYTMQKKKIFGSPGIRL